MGKIVVTEFISLDGVIEAPGGDYGFARGPWTFEFDRGQEGNMFKVEEIREAEVQLLGRKTYEGFAAAWPERDDEIGFAKKMNSMPKYVVSNTLTEPTWNNTTVISGDVVKEISDLRHRTEGVILVAGSADLVSTLLANDLIDELRLMLFPIVLGTGQKLFTEADQAKTLRLTDTKQVGPDGVIILTYKPKR
jgi:dihydrofolate reductase